MALDAVESRQHQETKEGTRRGSTAGVLCNAAQLHMRGGRRDGMLGSILLPTRVSTGALEIDTKGASPLLSHPLQMVMGW